MSGWVENTSLMDSPKKLLIFYLIELVGELRRALTGKKAKEEGGS